MSGRCRYCGCSHFNPCPGGCTWTNHMRTLCSACLEVDQAWQRGTKRHPMGRRAFFRGFAAGADDERSEYYGLTDGRGGCAVPNNPYSATSRLRGYWDRGFAAGERNR